MKIRYKSLLCLAVTINILLLSSPLKCLADPIAELHQSVETAKRLRENNQSSQAISMLQAAIKRLPSEDFDSVELANAYCELAKEFREADRAPEALDAEETAIRVVEKNWQNKPTERSIDDDETRGLESPAASDRLKGHVICTGAAGLLSSDGIFSSSPVQIEDMFKKLEQTQDRWIADGHCNTRNILLYAHGGLVSEKSGLRDADSHLDWWMNNGIYPVSFVWQSGIRELIRFKKERKKGTRDLDDEGDSRGILLPATLVDEAARRIMKPLWVEMKNTAIGASAPITAALDWGHPEAISSQQPGASLLVDRLKQYVAAHPDVRVHLMCHSAGSIFCIGLLERLHEAGIKVATITYLAPAMRVSDFRSYVLPRIKQGQIGQIAIYNLDERLEQNDISMIKGIGYKGSILCLVSHCMEEPELGETLEEVPLLGMSKFLHKPIFVLSRSELADVIKENNGTIVISNGRDPNSSATAHSGFADDQATLVSATERILGKAQGSMSKPTAGSLGVGNSR